ncbi:ead/Ea22-like family protein, partial [Enterobacter asburiae]
MSNIDKRAKRALREAAERAKDNFIPSFKVPTRDLLALLDELEAAEKRIAELEARQVLLPP